MPVCASCGHVNPAGARFCLGCGAAFAAAEPGQSEQRKTVTVVFCDVAGSTPLGEALDPEALRSLLARYFERMKAILERHGGTVEKFIGDAVMAVFGVPAAHEDDAVRALRAAVEMRGVFPELGIEGRIGIATGEVVTGTEERLATGDALNVAQRLEAAAQPGEILLGEETFRLAEGAADVEALAPLALKGKRVPVAAYRLLGVDEHPARLHESRFVGREHELEELEKVWRLVVAEHRCVLVTVVGEAGIGKSRLVSELLDRIEGEAEVVGGRCLPYGEGITYWPVVEALEQLESLPSDPAAAAALRSLLGETEQAASAEEIAWGFRKLLEEQAQQHPLLCVFDDLQWGEETFLDLLEHLALLSSGAPILLVCMARPELEERRAGWPVSHHLEPLAEDAVEELIPKTLPEALRKQISHTAAGNPLFLTEMAALARGSQGGLSVPPTLKALLGARLDQSSPEERHLLQCASVEGELFHRGALLALVPEQAQLTPRLASLTRKGLLHPAPAQLAGEDAFRFHHLLFRDTAYEALPKATRASLHERFAEWLEGRGDDIELEETAGYHLEQAARYRDELGVPESALAERASEHLAGAGLRALWRGDLIAARGLLQRALALTRPLRLNVVLELALADAQTEPRLSAEMAEAAAEAAHAEGDEVGAAVARVVGAHFRSILAELGTAELEELARKTLPLAQEARDNTGLVYVWAALADVAQLRGHFEEATQALEEVMRHSRFGRGGFWLERLELLLVLGPRPADQALRSLDPTVGDTPRPFTTLTRAELLAMLGRLDEARLLAAEASERLHELTGEPNGWVHADIAGFAGDLEHAVRFGRDYCDYLERTGRRGNLSTAAPNLGRRLCALGRYEEAESLAQLGRELGDEGHVATQMLWRQAQALVLASRGQHAQAEALAREAVALAEKTDALNRQGDAFCDLSEVLAAAGRSDEAATALEQALERYERKKNLAMVAQVRPRLAKLTATRGSDAAR